MIEEKNWIEVEKLAAHYRAIGLTDIRLDSSRDSYPWPFVVSVEEGCVYRMHIPVSIGFTALTPSGITYRWAVDIESQIETGSVVKVDIAKLLSIKNKLPTAVHQQFRDLFKEGWIKLSRQLEESETYMARVRQSLEVFEQLRTL